MGEEDHEPSVARSNLVTVLKSLTLKFDNESVCHLMCPVMTTNRPL